MGKKYPAVQLFCNAHTALAWLYLLLLWFYLIEDTWLRLAIGSYFTRCIIITSSYNFFKNHRKVTCDGISLDLQLYQKVTIVGHQFIFSCEFCKSFKNIYFVKHLQTAASERLWCNKGSTISLQYKDILEPY